MLRPPPAIILLALAALCSTAPAANPPMIGFRFDGTGVFPDARPPTEFNGVTGQNLRWKVPLPNHSNSSPIVVGDRVFVTCAAGWPEGQDCARLLCFGAADGKELWRRDLDEFATLPDARAREARDVRREYHRRIHRLNRIMFEYQSAAEPRRRELFKEAESLGAMKAQSFETHSWGTGSAEQNVFGEKSFARKLTAVCGYARITWSPTCLDMAMPTPVSDGKRIFVYTGRKSVHAFDLDGNVLWQLWQSDAPFNYHWPEDLAHSPLLVDGKLLMHIFDHVWAYDPANGRLLWKTLTLPEWRHGCGMPQVLRLPSKAGPPVTALATRNGYLIRISDGKVLCEKIGQTAASTLGTDGVDRLFTQQTGVGGHYIPGKDRTFTEEGSQAVRFILEGDTARAELLWHQPQARGTGVGTYPFYRDGTLLTGGLAVLDADTGKVVVAPRTRADAYHGWILAGGHLYGIPKMMGTEDRSGKKGPGDRNLVCWVIKDGRPPQPTGAQMVELLELEPKDPSKRDQRIALTGRAHPGEWYAWHGAYSAPFVQGERLYIRTFDNLYCFGAK